MATPTSGPDAPATVTIPVSGMTCASCTSRVERALTGEAGVADASVNLMLRQATVSFDPALTTPDRLVEAIRATGYEAELADPAIVGEPFYLQGITFDPGINPLGVAVSNAATMVIGN